MISAVIPSRGEGATLLRCIAALSQLDGEGEIVVAAWGESRAVRRRAERCGRLRWIECPSPSRGAQLNRGGQAAHGDALIFVHADTRLPAAAAELVTRALAVPGVVGGGFRLRFDRAHPALGLLERLSALPWRSAFFGDQALFCRRRDFEAAGGFRESRLFEDVDLAWRLSRRGRLVRLPAAVTTSARRFAAAGPWRQLALNASLLSRYYAGARPEQLAKRYRP